MFIWAAAWVVGVGGARWASRGSTGCVHTWFMQLIQRGGDRRDLARSRSRSSLNMWDYCRRDDTAQEKVTSQDMKMLSGFLFMAAMLFFMSGSALRKDLWHFFTCKNVHFVADWHRMILTHVRLYYRSSPPYQIQDFLHLVKQHHQFRMSIKAGSKSLHLHLVFEN